jgi:hypothetical protein
VEQEFIYSGYTDITLSKDVRFATETYNSDDFINTAYLDCTYQDDEDFSHSNPLVKPIVFYLPQFHEIPENNEWWGKGFTEWSNTSKAKPRFTGHYQPREPHDDIGYYDLSDADTIRKQATMAKNHGIYGWCIYYYWFSGRKLLTKPLDLLLENKDIDIGFCLCWCNESWSKSWIGEDKEILIKCEYQDNDPVKFIEDLKKYTDDSRYIKYNGKPLIVIYKTHDIPNARDFIRRWRKRALEIGIGEIAVFSTVIPYSINDMDLQGCFEGETDFSPARYAASSIELVDEYGTIISDELYHYEECIENYTRAQTKDKHKTYLSCMCGWDSSPRYERHFRIYDLGFSLKQFYDHVKYVVEDALRHDKEYIFVFAWNEWAEGAYIEPDKRFGYTMLNTFTRAICGLPLQIQKEAETDDCFYRG